MTLAGLVNNKEQITVSKSWADPTQKYIVEKLSDEFERLWKGEDQDCLIVPLPEAIKQDILKNYSSSEIPTEDELNDLWAKAQRGATSQKTEEAERTIPPRPAFSIPTWLKYDEGPYAHQGRAIAAWVEAGFRGTLEMATGSGKTLTAMIGAFRLYELQNPLLIVVSAPYVPLIQQWCSEITLFGLQPVNLTTLGNATERSRVLQQLRRRLRLGLSNVEIVVVSHDTLCTSSFIESLRSFECSRLLIADEAHNLGRDGFIKNSPDFIEYRLALSATPIRQYDPEGTLELLDYFGSIVFRFTLADAIGKCLVEYDYYVHPVELSEAEMDSWVDLTARIRQISWRQIDGAPDDFLAKLLRDRRAILETAKGKIPALASLLDREDIHSLKHTLIYASDKAPEQLRSVNALLNRKGILFHQLTSEETADRAKTASIIRAFQNGELQVLTAKRVLDEGVNIPQITKAYILASTTVGRQWIQRRGRLLRICPEIGKTHSVIHDFVVLPPMLEQALDDDARSLVKSELIRLQDFASLARNAGKPDGPLPVIHKLVEAAML
jgi:superfamily II DNA or RNA helicase